MAKKRRDTKGRVLKKGESQRENGTYMYRWTNLNGKPECIYEKTLEKLREKEDEIAREMAMGISRTSVTLNEQIETYLELRVKLQNSTKENYKYYYGHVIKDNRLGKMKVIDIKKTDVLRFYKEMSKNGYSVGTIKILHKIIRPALQLACDDDVIYKNPADGCTKEYVDDVEKKYALTPEQEFEFLERVKSRPKTNSYYPLFAILLKIGLRISEAIGLTWDDVDMKKREIDINHQVQYRPVEGKVKYYANKTKTDAGKRIIPMTDEVYELFCLQRKEWMKSKKDADFEVDGYKNFVFLSNVTGRCLNPNNIRRTMLNLVTFNEEREVQLPALSPHILRHTAITRAAEKGYDIKVLQYLFGHSDLRTTMRVYNHVDSERVKKEVERIEELMRKRA